MGRILAFDYGQKRIGLAVTDPLQIIASPLLTISISQIESFLNEYLKKEVVDEFVEIGRASCRERVFVHV
jgi:putative holliday junction resolvase